MADSKLTPEQLQEQLDAANARAEAAEKELALAAAKGKVPAPKVPGSVKLKLATPDGSATKTVSFVDGAIRTRSADGELLPSVALIKLANGGEATAEQLATYPALQAFDKQAAIDLLTRYATMGVAFLNVK